MMIGWIIALLIKNTSYVDVLWAYGVGVLGLSFLVIQSDQCHPARLAVLEGILAVWSLRLGTHLLRRCWGKPEDARYAYLREYLGKNANLGFFFSFRFKPSGFVLFASPFLILVQNSQELGVWDHLGLIIWITGFVGVSLADKQLGYLNKTTGTAERKYVTPGCGNIPGIPITFSNGFSGLVTFHWASLRLVGPGSS